MSDGTVLFLCNACGFKARVPDAYAGKTILCPGCQQPGPVPTLAPTGARITRVAMTPEPFALTQDQLDALASTTRKRTEPGTVKPPTGPTVSGGRRLTTPLPMPTPVPMPVVSAGSTPTPEPQPAQDEPTRPNTSEIRHADTAKIEAVDFHCAACQARVKLPRHYLGRNILCPRCSAPQRVIDPSCPAEPMGTTRSLHKTPVMVGDDQDHDPTAETQAAVPESGPRPGKPKPGAVTTLGIASAIAGAVAEAAATAPTTAPAASAADAPPVPDPARSATVATPLPSPAIAGSGGTTGEQRKGATTDFPPVVAQGTSNPLTRSAERSDPTTPLVLAPRWVWPLVAVLVVLCTTSVVAMALAWRQAGSAQAATVEEAQRRTAVEQDLRATTEELRRLRDQLSTLLADLGAMRRELTRLSAGSATPAAHAPPEPATAPDPIEPAMPGSTTAAGSVTAAGSMSTAP